MRAKQGYINSGQGVYYVMGHFHIDHKMQYNVTVKKKKVDVEKIKLLGNKNKKN